MGRTSRLTERAIELVRSGNLTDARLVLVRILEEEPDNWLAWGWYHEVARNDADRILALENLLRIRPDAAKLQQQLNDLLKKQAAGLKQPPAAAPSLSLTTPRLAFLLLGLLLAFGFLLVRNAQASRQVRSLTSANRQITLNYNALDAVYTDLMTDFQSLESRNNQLAWEYQNLQGAMAALQTNYNDLQLQYNLLNQQFASLESKAIVPPYIYIRGRDVWTAFEKTNGQIIYWKTPFAGLEQDLQRGNEIRSQINRERGLIRIGFQDQVQTGHWLRLPYPETGQVAYVVDARLFVDWREFKDVIPELYYQAQDEQEFIQEIWNIVAQLTTYSTEITDTPRYPLETLLAGGGDCEDTSILFASMILAAPVDWNVYMVYMDGNNPYDRVEMNHVIVYIETATAAYQVETTRKDVMDPYVGYVDGWYYEINK